MLAVYLNRSDRLLRTVRIGLFAYLHIRRCGGGCRAGSTGGGDVLHFTAAATGSIGPSIGAFLNCVVIGVMEYDFISVSKFLLSYAIL